MLMGRDADFKLKLVSATGDFDYLGILHQWMKVGFDPAACHRILQEMVSSEKIDSSLIDPSAILKKDTLVARDNFIYPKKVDWQFSIALRKLRQRVLTPSCDSDEVKSLSNFISWATTTNDRNELSRKLNLLQNEFDPAQLILAPGDLYEGWPRFQGPGMCRLEHATMLIQSETTRIIFDPIELNRRFPQMSEALIDEETPLDAIFITHGHEDHFHLPTLLHLAAKRQIPIYVPKVKATSLFALKPFEEMLAAVGLRGIPLDWNTTVKIGDIEVDVLPFYGEQPTVTEMGVPKDVRNWGNCYRVNTPQFSICLMVDSGDDPQGTASGVLEESTARRGPPDVVSACTRTFKCPFFGGLSPYWTVIPFTSLRRLYDLLLEDKLPPVTAGPSGIAKACVATGTKYFLPYANGFEGVGREIKDIGWGEGQEPSEKEALAEINAAIGGHKGKTQVYSWTHGDFATFEGRELKIITRRAI